ncbi:SprT-like domain-containing protein [Actinomadura sp. WMMB 499]|uniref:SprT-like domain-containing protein n=1 Tax=Actinomadura sp. WMMB 499 TaxID=1219491 RepID=UPI00159E97D0|nr:SprT-like domain-containing protein [Actinomadura sp. WMMB 499]
MRPWFSELRHEIPDLYISVSFPVSGGRSGKRIGECHHTSEDGSPHVLVHPYLNDATRVLDVVLHELVHATLGYGAGHGAPFRRLAEALGLTGKMTATVATDELREVLADMVRRGLGPYPHSALQQYVPKQTTRQIKATCPEPHGEKKNGEPEYYVTRVSRKWIEYWTDRIGYLACPCGEPMIVEE